MKTRTVIALCVAFAAGTAGTLQAQQERFGLRLNDYQIALDGWTTKPLETKLVKGQPYSAEVISESIQTLSDGNRIVKRSTSRVYRDSMGRVRREEDRASGGPVITISDPVANLSLTLDATTKTVRETIGLRWVNGFFAGLDRFGAFSNGSTNLVPFPLTDSFYSYSRQASTALAGQVGRIPGSDYSEEHLPSRTIEGVTASGFRRTTTIPKGAIGNEQPIKIVSEEWTSPDLQVLVLTDFNDPRSGRSTYKLQNIVRAEPDAALFKAPADYKKIRGFLKR